MKTKRTIRTAAFAASLAAWCGWGAIEARGQDPLWIIGSQQVHFPQEPGTTPGQNLIKTSLLPTSFDPDIPDAYEYQGQVAQRTQNIQYDEEGKVLFFIIDGNVFNRDGLLIADDAEDIEDRDCEVCFMGGEQVHIIPLPGSCTRYYVMGLFFDNFQRDSQSSDRGMLRWGVLDLSLKSDLPVYADACAEVNGRFMNYGERDAPPGYNLFGSGWGAIEVYPDNAPLDAVGYLNEGAIYTTASEGPETIYGASIRLDANGKHALVLRVNVGLVIMEVNELGIWKTALPAGYIGHRWPFNLPNGNTDLVDFDLSQRADMSLHYESGLLKVAWNGYHRFQFPPLNNVLVHQTRVAYWEFNIAPGTPMAVTSALTPANVPLANPRVYSLDLYPVAGAPPQDFAGNAITRPAVPGIEFSPNGRYIYFIKSPDFAYPNSGGPESNLGYVDTQWQLGGPGTYYTYLPIGANESRKLVDSQIDLNVKANGFGQSLYAIGIDAEGTYWLSALHDPDNPSASNWQPELVELDAIGSFNEGASPTTEFRFLNRKPYLSNHQTFLQQELCCEDLTLAKDRSTTITTDCDLTWEPGDNAFWNTSEPIHVATELRIAAGAHVVAQNMTFKFGENAFLNIEPGASLRCTNCLFTNACTEKRWFGIAVGGNQGQHQFGSPHPTYVGELVLRASTIEHAVRGISTSGGVLDLAAANVLTDTDDDGEPDTEVWTRTIIRNCHQGVMMRNYGNFNPSSGTGLPNRSRFDEVLFSVDDEYMSDYAFKEHVYLWKVSGITFIACTFENTLPDAFFGPSSPNPNGPFHGSAFLGHGIRSLDANFRVTGKCGQLWLLGDSPCPESLYTRSAFTGLDHGIHALQGSKLRNFTVDRALFTDNIAGVYADGVVGYVVKNSNFSIGDRNVEMTNIEENNWLFHHRGIYSKRCYGFTVDDNTLYKSSGSPTNRLTEGVVIGYSGDHNDYVFRNHGRDLSWGFVGEGNCASTEDSQAPILGLQLICNTNQNNAYNLSSRKASGATNAEQASHTIRTQQGDFWRQADNLFDGWPLGNPTKMDYHVTTTFNPISYWHQGSTTPYRPESFDPLLVPAPLLWPPLANNCAAKIPSTIPTGPGMVLQDVQDYLEAEKLAYGNIRYLYQQLIDGGNTDEVVDEITAAWPQDAFDLRDYLLSKSPYLSYSVLKELNMQNKLPQALFAQVCIANPEATKSDGFYNWLENEAPYQLTESLLAAIVASWEERTFRSTLEAQMAGHHAAMSQAANVMLEHLTNSEEAYDIPALRGVWQEIRTPAARYAEALSLLDDGDYTNAAATVTAIPTEHDLKAPDCIERQRMLDVIAFLATVSGDGRAEDELTAAEQDALEALVDGQQDRPASWAQNILCFHYNRCVAPWTGDDGEPKSLPRVKPAAAPNSALSLQPNPTSNWAVAKMRLSSEDATATLRVLDVTGKQVATYRLSGQEPQLVLDSRPFGTGAYLVELLSGNEKLASEKLIVQP